MMVRVSTTIGIVMAALSVADAQGQDMTVGAKGGVYCTDAKEFERLITDAAAGRQGSPAKTCKPLAQGEIIKVIKKEEMGNGIVLGVGMRTGTVEPIVFSADTSLVAAPSPIRSSVGRSFKRVSPADVRNTPTKWADRDVEFSGINVYWVDENDVRFVTSESVTVSAVRVRGSDGDLNFLRQNCETEREALSRRCRANIRFSYTQHGTDKPTGMMTRVVLTTDDIEVIRPPRR